MSPFVKTALAQSEYQTIRRCAAIPGQGPGLRRNPSPAPACRFGDKILRAGAGKRGLLHARFPVLPYGFSPWDYAHRAATSGRYGHTRFADTIIALQQTSNSYSRPI
jgi:hypothetical protein